jgi:hypothetical protein
MEGRCNMTTRITKEVNSKAVPRTVDFARVLTSAPINADAARAVSQTGEHFAKANRNNLVVFDAPPRRKPLPRGLEYMVGIKFGRFTVVSYYRWTKNKKDQWVVRCACGVLTVRSGKAIRNPANAEDRCLDCADVLFKREGRIPNGKKADLNYRERCALVARKERKP